MKIPVKIVRSFLFLVFCTQIFVPIAHAQTQLSSFMQTDGNVPQNITTLTQGVFFGLISSATCIVGGIDFMSPSHHCLTYNPQKGTFSYANDLGGGILGLQASSIATLYNSPVHTADYIDYLSSNFGVVKKADAASGFDQLNPISKLWVAFRNISYLLFVIIFVVIGFAIMVRAKIDPRTVMTIENQIPKLVIALILISFSFAIAGLAIDIMWVSIYFILNLFASLDPVLAHQLGPMTNNISDMPLLWLNNLNNGHGGFLGIPGQAADAVRSITSVIAFGIFQRVGFLKIFVGTILGMPLLVSCFVTNILHVSIGSLQIGQDFGACLDSGMATAVSWVIEGIAFLIFAGALIVALFKMWWGLLKAFALFHIYVILGPIMIMAGVLPGSKINFENWLRHIIAYIAVFPAGLTIFLLGKTLMDVYTTTVPGFTPPLIGGNPQESQFLGPLLGFAVFMLAPSTTAMVQEALSAPDFKFLPQIGQGFAAGAGFVTGATNRLVERSWHPRNLQTGTDEAWLRKMVLGPAENSGEGLRGRLRQFIEGTRLK